MFGRENLNCSDMVQYVKSVNEIMNKMEARIKELESDLEKWQEAFLGERRAVVAARKERDEAIAEMRKLEGLA